MKVKIDEIIAGFADKTGVAEGGPSVRGSYAFEFDGMRVDFASSADGASLVMLAAIGTPPDEGREELYRAILEAHGSDNTSVSLRPADGRLFLRRAVDLDGLDVAGFESALEEFLALLEEWRGLVAAYVPIAKHRSRDAESSRIEIQRAGLGMSGAICA